AQPNALLGLIVTFPLELTLPVDKVVVEMIAVVATPESFRFNVAAPWNVKGPVRFNALGALVTFVILLLTPSATVIRGNEPLASSVPLLIVMPLLEAIVAELVSVNMPPPPIVVAPAYVLMPDSVVVPEPLKFIPPVVSVLSWKAVTAVVLLIGFGNP